ncbi:MAG: ABC transporter substrate-binding protein [Candidatus Marinimicrobia bacterium]|nr:ABC transporter substrate-binding protein [Candidatus Neomarinimicrobiota bacterium]
MKKVIFISIIFLFHGILFSQNWLQQRIIAEQFDKTLEHYDKGRYATADKILQRILKKPTGEFELPVHLLAMKTSLALDQYDEAKEFGKRLLTHHNQHEYISETFMVLGDIFVAEGDMDGAFRMYMRSRQLCNEAAIEKIDIRLKQIIKLGITDRTIAEQQLLALGDNEIILNLALAFTHLQSGNPDECAFALSNVHPALIPETYYDLYEQLLLASYQPALETFTFGVVLPLTGKNAESGLSFLKGLHQSTSRPGQQVNIAFQIEDNHSDPLETVKAIQRLAGNRQLLGIVASLNDHESLVAVNAMKNKAIPLIVPGGGAMSFTEVGEHVFQLQSDWSNQGKLAARWIGEYLVKDSVAIITSSDKFGNAVADAFLKEMDALDKTVVAVQRYSGKPENLEKQFKALRQTAFNLLPPENPYDEFLGMSFDSLDALFDVNTEDFFGLTEDEPEEKIKDSSKVELMTIQALYLPIHENHLNYIGTQLPMYNLNTSVVGNFAWNQPDILAQDNVGPHLEGMHILSHKNAESDAGSPSQIEDDDFLWGYDVSGLITAICNSGITNRTEFIHKLEQTHYDGMVFGISFSRDDHSNSTMHVLKCENRLFMPVGTFIADTVQFHVQQRP